jgi:carboxymethylenebutenolidase
MRRITLIVGLLAFVLVSCRTVDPSPAGRLETTPRHDEWVTLSNNGRSVTSYVVYPEVSHLAMAVVVIHENRGLTDWVRSVADRLAEAGYIAIAPDFLSGMAPGGGDTPAFASLDAARTAISQLPSAQVMGDLDAAIDYAQTIPAASGRVAVAGFCWGGSQTFAVANRRSDLAASFVFYGTGPQTAEGVARINAPVFGFYAGNDARVNATIPPTEQLMQAAGKHFEYVIYDDSGHGFMRAAEEPEPSAANRRAATEAWQRWLMLLRQVDGRS